MTKYTDNYGNIYTETDGFFLKEEIERRVKMGDLILNKQTI